MKRIFYSLLFFLSLATGAFAQGDYTDGVFVLNEGWFGHCNSSINYLDDKGSWIYNVIEKENPGIQLGSTTSYGTIYGNRFYIITKQDKDSGTDKQGARITICDAATMKVIKQIKDIDNENSRADGRGFVALNNEKAYVGTNKGVYIFDLVNLEIKGLVEGTENTHTDPYGKMYLGQSGSLLRVNDRVYALHQDKGLIVIDPVTDKVINTVAGPDNGELTYGSAVLSKDGNIWMSVSDRYGRGDSYRYIMRYTPSTGDTLRVNMPEGINAPANSWFAWTPDGFCASTQNNVLYWNSAAETWYNCNKICRYDIDSNEFSLFIDFASEDLKVYGSSMRVDPVSDNLYVTLYEDPGKPYFLMRKYDNTGAELAEYEMSEDYWFPSIPVFPDNESPVAKDIPAVNITDSKALTVSLDNIAADADNMSAAMVTTVADITDKEVVSADVINGSLNIVPLKDGNSTVVLDINSNGRKTSAEVAISVTGYNGIDNASADIRGAFVTDGIMHIDNCDGFVFSIFDVSGRTVDSFEVSSSAYVRSFNLADGMYVLSGTSDNEKVVFKINIR